MVVLCPFLGKNRNLSLVSGFSGPPAPICQRREGPMAHTPCGAIAMSTTITPDTQGSLLASLLSDETFRPSEPRTLEEAGLPASLVESLVCKYLTIVGASSGRGIAKHLCLPFGTLEHLYNDLRTRQVIVHTGSAALSDYTYSLTEQGRVRANAYMEACSYVGAAPVPLADYVLSAQAQTIRAEAPKRRQLSDAFADISVKQSLFESLGPAVNSGAGMFLYGCPGNGKSTLAKRIT